MSAAVVFEQMVVIFLLMIIGAMIYIKGKMPEQTAKNLSWLVVNLCSPALTITAVMGDRQGITRQSLLIIMGVCVAFYVVLILLSYVVTALFLVSRSQKLSYRLMTIFGNTGFIGIPVAHAVLGESALIYVAVFNFFYSLIFYTYGIYTVGREARRKQKHAWKSFFNTGTMACIVVLAIFWFEIPIPAMAGSIFTYIGGAATCLSMFVIGSSLAKMQLKEFIEDKRLLLFTLVRFLIFPVCAAILLKPLLPDLVMRGSTVLMAAVPVGNMAAMVVREHDMDDSLLVRGIIVTTVFSVVSITITGIFM